MALFNPCMYFKIFLAKFLLLKCFESDFNQNMSHAPSKCLKQQILKVDKLDYFKNASQHLKIWVTMSIQKDWKAKIESAFSFMFKYSKITVWKGINRFSFFFLFDFTFFCLNSRIILFYSIFFKKSPRTVDSSFNSV